MTVVPVIIFPDSQDFTVRVLTNQEKCFIITLNLLLIF